MEDDQPPGSVQTRTIYYTMACSARQKGHGQHVPIKDLLSQGSVKIRPVIGQWGSVWLYLWCSHWSESVWGTAETGLQNKHTAELI